MATLSQRQKKSVAALVKSNMDKYRRREPIADQVREHFAELGSDECWLWSDNTGRNYVRVRVGTGMVSISKAILGGDGVGMHTCDTPPCINPNHLKLGTDSENAADKVAKGRWAGNSKITDEQAADIAERYEVYGYNKTNSKELAMEFGITPDHVTRIARGGRILVRA